MREEFEKLPQISSVLRHPNPVVFDEENNMYIGGSDEDYYWINGAWSVFKELQKSTP